MATNAASTAIIIPSYKETENLYRLIPILLEKYPHMTIVVVDDSPGDQQEKLTKQFVHNSHVQLIFRQGKSGRGSAVIDGMRYALSRNVQWIIEMDADLSHQPEECAVLLSHRNDADIIIGSRYIPGSKIIRWPLSRLIQSKIINAFLNIWLGVGISDYTNGFRLYNRKACEFLCGIRLREKGYITLSETAYRAHKNGLTIKEVPCTFIDRTHGKSKAGLKELLTSLMGAIRIRLSAQ